MLGRRHRHTHMTESRYWHNPRCSKSREALALLKARGVEPDLVDYLDGHLDAAAVREVLAKLGLPARQLLRTGEQVYGTLQLADQALDEARLIAAMVTHPTLIERPIFIHGDRAVIGRPPEQVLTLLE